MTIRQDRVSAARCNLVASFMDLLSKLRLNEIETEKSKYNRLISEKRQFIAKYDSNSEMVGANSSNSFTRDISEESDLSWYKEQQETLRSYYSSLYKLRLQGGIFMARKVHRVTSFQDFKARANPHHPSYLYVSDKGRILFITSEEYQKLWNHYGPSENFGKFPFRDILDSVASNFFVADIDQIHRVQIVNRRRKNENSSDSKIFGENDSTKILRIDLKSKKRALFSVENAEELFEIIGAHLKHFNHKKTLLILRVKELYKYKNMRFNTECLEQSGAVEVEKIYSLLARLWNAVFCNGSEKSYAVKEYDEESMKELLNNPKWTCLGFQNSKPLTDFRGSGLLGLWTLVYLAEKSRGITFNSKVISRIGWIQELVEAQLNQDSNLSVRQYPFAAAGVNLICVIFDRMLCMDDEKLNLPTSDAHWDIPLFNFLSFFEPRNSEGKQIEDHIDQIRLDDAFKNYAIEEFFCLCMDFLDRLFISQSNQYGYLDFPVVMKRLENELQTWINPQGTHTQRDFRSISTTLLHSKPSVSRHHGYKPNSLSELSKMLDKMHEIGQ